MPLNPHMHSGDSDLRAPTFKELGDAYVAAGQQASANLVSETLTAVKENVVAPAFNAGVLEPANTVISGINAVYEATGLVSASKGSTAPLIKSFEHMHVAQAEFLSAGWAAQTVSGGLGAIIPYVIAGKAAGSAMRAGGSTLALEGGAARLMQSQSLASVVGAFAYDGAREVRQGESRLGNSVAGAAGFGVFEVGNMLAAKSGLVGRIVTRTATGMIGGGVQTLTSTAIAEGKLADGETLTRAAAGGIVMSHALPVGQKVMARAADRFNLATGRGVPLDRLVQTEFAGDASTSPTFKNIVNENPWARIQSDAPQSLARGTKRVELEAGADAAKLGHELEHLSQKRGGTQEQNFQASAKLLQDGKSAEAWQLFRETRLNQELDARSTEAKINSELGKTKVSQPSEVQSASLAVLIPNLKVGQLTYEQHWKQEFSLFQASNGKFRPAVDFHGEGEVKSDLSAEAESAYQRELGAHLVQTLQDKQHIGVFAGGAVRDLLMRKTPKDYDIATSATPDQVEKLFIDQGYKVIPVGKAFGVINVVVNGREFEIATLRSESTYSDGRRPDGVQFVTSLAADAARRDLTINAMFQDPISGTIYDFYGGQHDLAGKTIRAVGDPNLRFGEDKLRMMRVPRFASKYEGFTVDPATLAAIKANSIGIHAVSNERIRDEIKGILLSSNPVRGIQIMMDSGLMKQVLPEVYKLKGPKGRQDPVHHPEGTVWTHTKYVLKNLTGGDFERMMGGLLHDVGKPATQKIWPDGGISNHGHDAKGAEITHDIARRLKMSSNQEQRVTELVRLHMIMHEVQNLRPGKLTALLERPDIMDLIEIQHADATGTKKPDSDKSRRDFLLQKLEDLKQSGKLGEKPIVNGNMLLAINMKPGPQFKTVLEAAREAQREGEFSNTEGAQRWLKENAERIAASTIILK